MFYSHESGLSHPTGEGLRLTTITVLTDRKHGVATIWSVYTAVTAIH